MTGILSLVSQLLLLAQQLAKALQLKRSRVRALANNLLVLG
jgi:uncharacterized membrane protein